MVHALKEASAARPVGLKAAAKDALRQSAKILAVHGLWWTIIIIHTPARWPVHNHHEQQQQKLVQAASDLVAHALKVASAARLVGLRPAVKDALRQSAKILAVHGT